MRNPATSDDMPGGFLTQKHSAQIDTPAFKRWFNGSVIVDAYGGPRIMYHGTVWTDISKFESYRAQKGIAGFFAFDPAFAADFAKMYAEEYENEGVRKSPTVYPVYLSLKKVFDVRKKSDREEIDWEIQPGSLGWDWADLEDSVNAMKRAGFDGYIDFEFGSNKPPTGIAVFNPGDIKSAIGNRGTFDRADPDIRNPVNRDSDSTYLDAVRRGDMKTAQRLVDAAAKAAGYTIESFHGTNGDLFTVFDPEKGGEKTAAESARLGIFSTDNAKVAQSYAENLGMGGAMGLAFGSGPFAKARADALETPQGKRLMQELEDSKQAVQKAHQKVRKEVTDKVMKQVESNPDLLDIVKRYGNEFVTSMVNNAWVSNEMYLSKAIVDAEKDQAAAEERLSNYIMPFIVAKLPNKRVLQLRLKINNPKIYDAGGKSPAEFSLSDKIEAALDLGYDGVIFNNIIDPVESATHYVVFKPEQIKLADAVTKDDAGQVIPLSQRFNSESPDIRNPYTKPDLRERLKRKIMAGSKGGNPGQWSARKAQLLASEYEKAGGGYSGKRTASQRSLSKWTKQDWRTKSGKPSLETGERYLPAAAITALTSAEYAETSRAKRKATGQFSRQPKRIAMKTSEYRNPKDPRSAMTQITGTEDTYINASKMLGGKVLDYGAGRGIGTDALRSNGLLADSFEPFPQNWEGKRPPTYTDSANIPSDSYDSLVSFSVINVVDPDERKFLFKEVARILRPDGVALITGRDRQDVQKATTKIPHLEEGGYLIGTGKRQRYQKGFTQAELERYAKEVLGPGFTVEANRALNGASIKITKGKPNPAKRDSVRSKLSRIIEPGDRMLCYDTASGEDFYRLWDIIHTAMPMTKEALVEIEGMLDDDGVLVIESGETPAGLQDHFRKATRYNGLLLVQGPKDPEGARIKTEELRRELE